MTPRTAPCAAWSSATAREILRARYLWEGETPGEMIDRVAETIARAEGRARRKWKPIFAELMRAGRFIPNSPTLMNAGREKAQLAACFVLPIEDHVESVFTALRDAALIHQSGGGTGFSFSRLRPKGSRISTRGEAAGPVAFLKVFDAATEAVKQGGIRRGANMGVLRVDHPDIDEFIDLKKEGLKRDGRSIANFNLSVGLTREFQRAWESGGQFELRDPRDGKLVAKRDAKETLNRIARAAWECGDPGLVFLDRIAIFNPTPAMGEMEATNPCGEQPLLPYEACTLGSMNLGAYASDGTIGWTALDRDIRAATRFLDNVVTLNEIPVEGSRRITTANRKIGLGVMGFADLLLHLRVPYGSRRCEEIASRVAAFLDRAAKDESAKLARSRGRFPNWKGSLWERLGYPPLRNATVSTVAPTGTISVIAGCSSGIEPIYSAIIARNVLDGLRLVELHPPLARVLEKRRADEADPESLSGALREELGEAWVDAHSVGPEAHIRIQAAFQRFSDSAVSKTVNLPNEATVADVERIYAQAYRLGCKGITVYRDRSRATQVLECVECV